MFLVLVAIAVAPIVIPGMLFRRRKCHDFADKHVVITGGSQGIGLALAQELSKAGARLTLIARSDSKLASAKATIVKQRPEAAVHTVSADVTDFTSVRTLALCSAYATARALTCTNMICCSKWLSAHDHAGTERNSNSGILPWSYFCGVLQRRIINSRCTR